MSVAEAAWGGQVWYMQESSLLFLIRFNLF